ncbi:MAG: hypothetical protein ABSB67_01635 [Bryobacteraceae bacterium]
MLFALDRPQDKQGSSFLLPIPDFTRQTQCILGIFNGPFFIAYPPIEQSHHALVDRFAALVPGVSDVNQLPFVSFPGILQLAFVAQSVGFRSQRFCKQPVVVYALSQRLGLLRGSNGGGQFARIKTIETEAQIGSGKRLLIVRGAAHFDRLLGQFNGRVEMLLAHLLFRLVQHALNLRTLRERQGRGKNQA